MRRRQVYSIDAVFVLMNTIPLTIFIIIAYRVRDYLSVEETVDVLKQHIQKCVETPVYLGWPNDDVEGVYVVILSTNKHYAAQMNSPRFSDEVRSVAYPYTVDLLMMVSPENNLALIDKMLACIEQSPSIQQANGHTTTLRKRRLNWADMAKIFTTKNKPFCPSFLCELDVLIEPAEVLNTVTTPIV